MGKWAFGTFVCKSMVLYYRRLMWDITSSALGRRHLMGKKKRDKEETFINELGQKIFVVDGTMAVKKLNAADYLFSGKEDCHDCATSCTLFEK